VAEAGSQNVLISEEAVSARTEITGRSGPTGERPWLQSAWFHLRIVVVADVNTNGWRWVEANRRCRGADWSRPGADRRPVSGSLSSLVTGRRRSLAGRCEMATRPRVFIRRFWKGRRPRLWDVMVVRAKGWTGMVRFGMECRFGEKRRWITLESPSLFGTVFLHLYTLLIVSLVLGLSSRHRLRSQDICSRSAVRASDTLTRSFARYKFVTDWLTDWHLLTYQAIAKYDWTVGEISFLTIHFSDCVGSAHARLVHRQLTFLVDVIDLILCNKVHKSVSYTVYSWSPIIKLVRYGMLKHIKKHTLKNTQNWRNRKKRERQREKRGRPRGIYREHT